MTNDMFQKTSNHSQLNIVPQHFIINHFLYTDEGIHSLFPGREILPLSGKISCYVQFVKNTGDLKIAETTIYNHSNEKISVKLIVENRMITENDRFVFVSPKKDVLFHSDEQRLCLTSGIWKGKSIRQYGAVPSDRNIDELLQSGYIGYNPIGKGNVSGYYTLEAEMEPNECSAAFTWAITSQSENVLLEMNESLQKNRLAFL